MELSGKGVWGTDSDLDAQETVCPWKGRHSFGHNGDSLSYRFRERLKQSYLNAYDYKRAGATRGQ